MKQPPITIGLGLVVGLLAGVGIATPLQAQIEDPPAIEPPTVIDDSEVGVPTPSPDATNPDATLDGTDIPLDQVILLNVDGVTRYYVPVNLDAAQLEGVDVPTYTLGENGAATAADSEATTPEGREPMVTYPPADSLEDLRPEDIVE